MTWGWVTPAWRWPRTLYRCSECGQLRQEVLGELELAMHSIRCSFCRSADRHNDLAIFFEPFTGIEEISIRYMIGNP